MSFFERLLSLLPPPEIGIRIFFDLSVATIIGFIVYIIYRSWRKAIEKLDFEVFGYKRKLFVLSLCLVISLFFFNCGVGYANLFFPASDGEFADAEVCVDGLQLFEQLIESFIYSLYIFGIDDGFGEYIDDVRNALTVIAGEGSWRVVFGSVYASLFSVIAPIAGGAIIFEIVASIFPDLLVLLPRRKKRDKYYFSELNDSALALIKSIYKSYGQKRNRPLIIITDSYVDDESETSVELLNEAKRYGAICVKNDIVHVRKCLKGNRKFFLIDIDENVNIQKLIELTESLGPKHAASCEFYPFVSSEIYSSVVTQVKKNLGITDGNAFVIPVNGYRNIVLNMLSDVPLFEPIVHQYAQNRGKQDTTLNITIFGTGQIGTEMLLGAYWCGQMLGCKLHVTVISRETEEAFENKINYINPEILESEKPRSPILKIYRDDKLAPAGAELFGEPYFTCKYISKDVKSEKVEERISKEYDEVLKKTNYFFVALGSDNENILMAYKLREILGNSHLKSEELFRTVINYVVFDSALCEALNQESFYSYTKDKDGRRRQDIYMRALGSIEELYSSRNVFLTEFSTDAQTSHERYYSISSSASRKQYAQSIAKDTYSYASNIARRVHRQYKVFSAGMWEKSIFDFCEEKKAKEEAEKKNAEENNKKEDKKKFKVPCIFRRAKKEQPLSIEEEYKKLTKGYWDNYVARMKEYTKTASSKAKQTSNGKQRSEEMQILDSLAWLEHRRWCAYLRSCGFRGPHIIEGESLDSEKTLEYTQRFLLVNGKQKNIELKRHICLVESAPNSTIQADMDEGGDFSNYQLWERAERDNLDMLDEVDFDYISKVGKNEEKAHNEKHRYYSDKYKDKWYKRSDYRQYDYPTEDFVKYHTVNEFTEKTGLSVNRVVYLCENEELEGAMIGEGNEWQIPAGLVSLLKTDKRKEQEQRENEAFEAEAKRAELEAQKAEAEAKERTAENNQDDKNDQA